MCSFRLSLILIVLAAFIVKQLHDGGELYSLEPVSGSCELVEPTKHGFEDFATFSDGFFATLDADHSHFQFTLGKSMRELVKEKMQRGETAAPSLLLVSADGATKKIPIQGLPREFFAHGLAGFGSVSSTEGGMLLVVNHRSDADSLDLIEVKSKDDAARFVREIRHPLLFNVNDCVFFARDEIYCTNWRSNPTGTLADAVEVYLRMPWNNVVRCKVKEGDEVDCREVAKGIQMANGIEVTKDRKQVIVVSTTGKALLVYDRDPTDGSLSLNRQIKTMSSCDNIGWNGDNVLLGCHPRVFTFVLYAKSPTTKIAPCEVLEVDLATDEVKTLYLDPTGGEFSGCSIATVTQDDLWLGAVHAKGILRCKRSSITPVDQMQPRSVMGFDA